MRQKGLRRDDAFGEGGLDEAFFAEDADSLIGTLEADEESAAFAVSAITGIYLDQMHGDDTKDGLTESTAVKTIEKANELANAKNINDICLSSFYKVTGAEVWDLGGKTLHRYKLGGYMIELADASASLTLSNVVIDGAGVQCGCDTQRRPIRSSRRRTAAPSC